jgi:hypothetical protein
LEKALVKAEDKLGMLLFSILQSWKKIRIKHSILGSRNAIKNKDDKPWAISVGTYSSLGYQKICEGSDVYDIF